MTMEMCNLLGSPEGGTWEMLSPESRDAKGRTKNAYLQIRGNGAIDLGDSSPVVGNTTPVSQPGPSGVNAPPGAFTRAWNQVFGALSTCAG